MQTVIFESRNYSEKCRNNYHYTSDVRVGLLYWYIRFTKTGRNWTATPFDTMSRYQRMTANFTITLMHPDASKSVKQTILEKSSETDTGSVDFSMEAIANGGFVSEDDTVFWQVDIEVLSYHYAGVRLFTFSEPLEHGFEIKFSDKDVIWYCRRELLAFHVPFIADLISSGVYSYTFTPGKALNLSEKTVFFLLQMFHGVHLNHRDCCITRYQIHKEYHLELLHGNLKMQPGRFNSRSRHPSRYVKTILPKVFIKKAVRDRMGFVEMTGEEMKLWTKFIFSLEESKEKNLSSDDCQRADQ